MKKPVIGVMPIYDYEKKNTWMLNEYFEGIFEAGGVPVMLPVITDQMMIQQLVEQLDGFLFTGGDDVDPSIYHKELTYSQKTYLVKDEMEKAFIEDIIKADKPYFGICRGLQILNASLGGTLYQDLQKEATDKNLVIHSQTTDRSTPIHKVQIEEESKLYSILKEREYEVNSLHHQAAEVPAKGLSVVAMSEDGLIEALEMKGKRFVIGVQWHPELRFKVEEGSKRLFEEFIMACTK